MGQFIVVFALRFVFSGTVRGSDIRSCFSWKRGIGGSSIVNNVIFRRYRDTFCDSELVVVSIIEHRLL